MRIITQSCKEKCNKMTEMVKRKMTNEVTKNNTYEGILYINE
jgi:hypothetical protein